MSSAEPASPQSNLCGPSTHKVTRLADRGVLQPVGVDIVLRVGGVRFETGQKLIDLDRLEAQD